MRRLWIIFLFIAIPAMMFADVVTEQDALLKAKQFMPGKSFEQPQKPNRAPLRGDQIESPAYYVFNATDNEGFVIVSADDRTEPILGYADNGCFDKDNMPSNVKAWFDYYEQAIRSLGDAPVLTAPQRSQYAPIEPLVTTKWNQSNPYNLLCPMDGEELSITGCVATAFAQIMYYHKWPAATTEEIPSYTTTKKKIQVEALPATSFKWDLMRNNYLSDATGDTANAVAELMRYCGQINCMDYTSEESAAYQYLDNIINYFNYNPNMRKICRNYYSNSQWEELIYNELLNNRPVFYTGHPLNDAGHAFVCDGYDGEGLFHINWGWGGFCDGYFLLSVLNPTGRGLGGGTSEDGYCDDQYAILGFAPATGSEELIPQMQATNVAIDQTDYSRISTDLNFESIALTGNIYAYYNIAPESTFDVEAGWAMFNNDNFVQCIGFENRTVTASAESNFSNNKTVSFGANLEDGQYRIYQVYRLVGDTEWILCENSIRECIIADIAGNSMTLQKINYSTMITVNSLTSVGTAVKNEKSYVKANITNNGKNYKQTIIIKYHKNGLMGNASSSTITYLNPGETSDVILSFTPSSSGIYVVTVGDVTIETPVIESILTISDFSTSIQPMLNVPFNLSFNVTYWGNDSVSTNIIKYWTKQEGEESWTEGDYFFIENITGVPVEKVLSFTPTALGTFQIRITNYDGTAEYATFSTTVKIGEFETIDGITYACDPETHNATIVSADKNVIPSELVIPSSITHNSIEYNVKAIADYAFYFNESTGNQIGFFYTGIEKLKISEGIETIGRGAFRECLYIRRLDLPSTIKRIGKNAFFGQGKDIIIMRAQNPIDIDESVFGDNDFEDYTFGVKLCVPVGTKNNYLNCTGWNLFKNVYEGNTMATIDRIQYVGISPSMEATMINYSQYYGVSNELVIPATITIDNEEYTVTGIDADGLKVEYFPVRSLIIPEGVKYLGNTSFANQAELTTVDLPSTLTYIGDSAFYKCDNIKNVITRVKTPFAIGNNTFSYGNTLLSVPSETEGLYKNTTGWNAFNYITEGLILEGEIKEKSINGITYEYGTESRYAFIKKAASETPLATAVQSSITINGIEYSVTAIEDGAYSGAIQSESTGGGWGGKPKTYHGTLVIPEGIKKIGAYAFGSNYFVALELPSTLMAIDENAFKFNYELKNVSVKSGKTPFAYGDIFSFTDYAWIDTLFVPGGAVADYQADSVWNKTNVITDSTTIIAKSYSIKYGQKLPTYAFTYKGAPVNGTPSISCSASSNSPAGSYPIKIGRGTVINDIRDTINGTLTINKVPLLITANSYTIKQGDPIPELQVTYQGFVNNEDSTALSKLPTLSTSATSSSDPGVYVITVSGAESPNYTISYVKGTITIEGSSDISYTQEKNESVSIYSLNGTLLYPDVDLQIVFDQLPSGIYIIRQKNQRTRKLVK